MKRSGSGGGGSGGLLLHATGTANRYIICGVNGAASGTAAFTSKSATTFLFPFLMPEAQTIDRLAIEVTTLGTGVLRLGIYETDLSLLVDAGTVSVTSTGVKEATISATAVAAGWHLYRIMN